MSGGGTEFVSGIGIAPVRISGWDAWALVDTGPGGRRRPIAFLDQEALTRIHEQAGAALGRPRQERGAQPGHE